MTFATEKIGSLEPCWQEQDVIPGKDSASLRHSFPQLNPNPVFEASLDSEIVYANPAARTALGSLESHPWLHDVVGEYRQGNRAPPR